MDQITSLSPSFMISAVLLALVTYTLFTAAYRLYFHPLSKFPGPRLAALTYKYEFYFDGIKGGRYTARIAEMHRIYGRIIRINPDELHINDPHFIDQVYAGGAKKRDKWKFYVAQFGMPNSGFSTISHDRHRMLRGAINRYFSKAAVTKLEPMIQRNVNKLCEQLEANSETGAPVDLGSAYSCFTTDVVTEYSFGRSTHFLDNSSFERNLRSAVHGALKSGPTIKQWPFLFNILESLPDALVGKMMPEMPIYLNFQKTMRDQIAAIKSGGEAGYEKRSATDATLFHELLNGDLPQQEKGIRRLAEEAQTVIGAGTETTAWTLTALTFYLLNDNVILSKLKEELSVAIPDSSSMPSWSTLEQLPYLNAVITEGLRLTYGVATRSARVANEPLVFRSTMEQAEVEWIIPPRTPVGMTSVLIHHNTDLFPDPLQFSPQRWLDEHGQRHRKLDQYLMSFSRGSRQCVGLKYLHFRFDSIA